MTERNLPATPTAGEAQAVSGLESQAPSWKALALVCKVCRKRRNGPQLKAKELALEIRKTSKGKGVSTRTLLTTCQGLCPKGATAVTFIQRNAAVGVFAIDSVGALEGVAERLG